MKILEVLKKYKYEFTEWGFFDCIRAYTKQPQKNALIYGNALHIAAYYNNTEAIEFLLNETELKS